MRSLVWICVLASLFAVFLRLSPSPPDAAADLRARIEHVLRVPDEGLTRSWLVSANINLCAELWRAGDLLSSGQISEQEFEQLSLWSSRVILEFCNEQASEGEDEASTRTP